ncbi:hypothetical protein EDB83DRAFT_2397253 [Lactarius deliciosus]|nr:hypothetical protein EDB83DRAFT_2397253 [Lactarius deliciosus]
MATDIGLFILASVRIMPHQTFSAISVFGQNMCIQRTINLNSFGTYYSRASIYLPSHKERLVDNLVQELYFESCIICTCTIHSHRLLN